MWRAQVRAEGQYTLHGPLVPWNRGALAASSGLPRGDAAAIGLSGTSSESGIAGAGLSSAVAAAVLAARPFDATFVREALPAAAAAGGVLDTGSGFLSKLLGSFRRLVLGVPNPAATEAALAAEGASSGLGGRARFWLPPSGVGDGDV